MGDDLEQEVRFRERGLYGGKICGRVLITHGGGCNTDRTVIERAYQGVDFGAESGARKLFGEAPQLASAGNWRMVIEKHAVAIAALATPERDRDDLSALCVIAEPS